jgi:hypothetical protein
VNKEPDKQDMESRAPNLSVKGRFAAIHRPNLQIEIDTQVACGYASPHCSQYEGSFFE